MSDILLPGTADLPDVLAGKTCTSSKGYKFTGTMTELGAINVTPSNVSQSFGPGHTTGVTVAAVTVPANKVLTGTTIAGTAGSIPVVAGGNTITPGTAAQQAIAAATYATSAINVAGDPNLVAPNIPVGNTIFGVAGTYSNIKSKQSGKALITANGQTITISAVDLTKAILRITYAAGSSTSQTMAYTTMQAQFLNATTIAIAIGNAGDNLTVLWEVIEFNGVKSLQYGSWSPAATSATLAISSVNPAKSMLFYSAYNGGATTTPASMLTNVEITSATLLTCTKVDTLSVGIYWYLVEFN